MTYEDLLTVAVAGAPCGVAVCDESGRILFANEGLDRMFGYAAGELAGTSVDQLVPRTMREAHAPLRQQFSSHPETRSTGADRYLEGQRKDGTRFPSRLALLQPRARVGPWS